MEAIIRHSGRQFKVTEGSTILVDTQDLESGSSLEFSEILYVSQAGVSQAGVSSAGASPEGTVPGSGSTKVGNPTVAGAKVIGTVLGEARGPKLIAASFRRRKNSRRRVGHRQTYTRVKIESIQA